MPFTIRILGVEVDTGLVFLSEAFLFLLYPFLFIGLIRQARAEFRALSPVTRSGRSERTVFQGIANADDLLIAPVSGTPCVAWHVRVFVKRGAGGEASHLNESKSVPFRIDGRLVELAPGFEFPRHLPCHDKLFLASTGRLPEALASRLQELPRFAELRKPFPYGAPHELRESRLEPGKACTVTGVVEESRSPYRGAPGIGAVQVRGACVAADLPDEARRQHLKGLSR